MTNLKETVKWRHEDGKKALIDILQRVKDGDQAVAEYSEPRRHSIDGEVWGIGIEKKAIRVGAQFLRLADGFIPTDLVSLSVTVDAVDKESIPSWVEALVIMDADGDVYRRIGGEWYIASPTESDYFDQEDILTIAKPVRVLVGRTGYTVLTKSEADAVLAAAGNDDPVSDLTSQLYGIDNVVAFAVADALVKHRNPEDMA